MFKFCCTSFSLSLSDPFKFFYCSIACCPLHTSPHAGLTESFRCGLNFSVLTPEHPYSDHFSVSEALLSWESVSVWMKRFGSYSWLIQVSEPLPGACACIDVCVSTCTWRSETDIGCLDYFSILLLLLLLIIFFSETRSRTEHQAHQFVQSGWPASHCFIPHTFGLMLQVLLAFYMGSKDGTQVFMLAQQTLPTEPSLPALCPGFVFCNDLL